MPSGGNICILQELFLLNYVEKTKDLDFISFCGGASESMEKWNRVLQNENVPRFQKKNALEYECLDVIE